MSGWLQPEPHQWWQTVDDALFEDLGTGDLTGGLFEPDRTADWEIEAQADGVACGLGILDYVLGPGQEESLGTYVELNLSDGERFQKGTVVATGCALARKLVAAERTALNFLMLLSGVATLTSKYVERVEGCGAKIVDTRKTHPMLRSLQKYAVRCGGGSNHRMGLFDSAMIKDNHVALAGSITEAVERYRTYASHMPRLEIECETSDQVEEAVAAGAEIVLLDNMDPFEMRDIVRRFKGECKFEASGGIDLDTVRGVAQTGVDYVSVGALTHSAPAIPFHLKIHGKGK